MWPMPIDCSSIDKKKEENETQRPTNFIDSLMSPVRCFVCLRFLIWFTLFDGVAILTAPREKERKVLIGINEIGGENVDAQTILT